MSKKVLFVLTSHDALGDTGGKTGTWLEELAAAYYVFVDGGYDADIVSIKAGVAPVDPASLEAPWLTAAGERFLADSAAQAKIKNSPALDTVDVSIYAGVYFVGGAGTAWDFPASSIVKSFVETVDRRDGIVAGVCHGVLALTTAKTKDGAALLQGKKVTGISNAEEEITTYDKIVPVLPESRMVELGAHYSKAAEPFAEHVVQDGNIVTGQNPASAALLVKTIVVALEAAKIPA